jgi:hypothetical protein
MNLDDFNKSLTGLVEEREKDTNKKDKNQFMSLMAVAEHGRPFDAKPPNKNGYRRTWKTI